MNKIVLTLAQKHGYANILMGFGFIILVCFDLLGGLENRYIGTFTNFLCSLAVLATFAMKSESDDERSNANKMKAGHLSFLLLLATLAVLSLILIVFGNIEIKIDIILRAFLGCGYTLYGYLFLYYEKAGE